MVKLQNELETTKLRVQKYEQKIDVLQEEAKNLQFELAEKSVDVPLIHKFKSIVEKKRESDQQEDDVGH